MIRPAKFGDIMRIVELLREMHGVSKYWGVDEVDPKAARELLQMAIAAQGKTNPGGSFVMVSVKRDEIEGFMVGVLDRVYHIGKKLSAKDLFLYCSPRADKMDLSRLFNAYIGWAMNNPRVVEINASWTDALPEARRISELYERKGFRFCGGLYERFVGDEPEVPGRRELLAEGLA